MVVDVVRHIGSKNASASVALEGLKTMAALNENCPYELGEAEVGPVLVVIMRSLGHMDTSVALQGLRTIAGLAICYSIMFFENLPDNIDCGGGSDSTSGSHQCFFGVGGFKGYMQSRSK